MDCVNLLIPGDYQRLPAPDINQGQQLPMPAELLEGVRTFLREDIAAHLEGHSAFMAKVAANSLGIAQREFLLGPTLAREEHARMGALLGDGSLEDLRWQPETFEKPGITKTAALFRGFAENRRFEHGDPETQAAFEALAGDISGCFVFQAHYTKTRRDQVAVVHKR